ncbi:hypothetical protein SPRG_18398 [Saprolegnia parasitica CBS 223.65]|uniref:Uncharacterized protein n=1 Tax=Saprolegnia parasitica (strain CBS 223.65) TaxID=695850 RepID=A0A067BD72_SAPPC|nr:hypothetical protein SPRG_18398 [Saprolegnia parasitica CBS 223.65]KDO16068.1 hypothetical protein SPRG_18398 [Saprolegnia parasitica CBS 223.65]|eukprot:XP_012213225.1 hypothetical protein SPRG_18398 [Saprolegnia parasitica CBS 223.65]
MPHSADVAATRSGSVYAVTDGRPRTRSNSRPGRMLAMHRTTKVRKKRSLATTNVSGQRPARTRQSVKLESVKTKTVKTESRTAKTKVIKAETVGGVRGTSLKLKVARSARQ